MDFQNYYLKKKEVVEKSLLSFLDNETKSNSRIVQAMKYVLNSGGKRIRSVMCLMMEDFCNEDFTVNHSEDLIKIACSIEYFHSYSLVHDDLPAMDDDNMRRGKPTCHKYFDEATAILCGDALQTKGFEILATLTKKNSIPEIILLLAKSIGNDGMIEGQMLDLLNEEQDITIEQLEKIHDLKTGKLLQASLLAPMIYYQNEKSYSEMEQFGKNIGLLFQVVDDILDVTQSSKKLGKPSQSDVRNEKATYVKLLSLPKAKEYATQLAKETKSILQNKKNSFYLEQLVNYILNRSY